MKKFLKSFFLVIGIAALLLAGYWAYHHFFKQKGSIDAFQAVPDDAIFVAATTNLTKASRPYGRDRKDLRNSP